MALLPGAAQACSVCFGQTDSPLGKGLHWGVFTLLVCITLMLAAFGAFAVYLVRRASLVEAEALAEEGQGNGGVESIRTV
jgi:hypothetical protein